MNKLGFLLIGLLFFAFISQIASDFYFRNALIMEKRNPRAVKSLYESCLKINPYHLKSKYNIAHYYIRAERAAGGIQKAFELLKEIEEVDYYFPDLHYKKANILCEFSRWDEAIKELHVALEQRSSDPKIYYDLGRIYNIGKKDFITAEKYFKKAIESGADGSLVNSIQTFLQDIKKMSR